MKGIILSGGLGSRMGLFTKRIGNKHLMPIYDRVMIEFPIITLVKAGITDITIVTGNRYSGQFIDLLGNGKEWGIEHLSYAYQFGEGGIADALNCARYAVKKGDDICVILGDNIFEDDFSSDINNFKADKELSPLAHVFLKEVPDPQRFGVANIHEGKIIDLVEKPENPASNYAVTGLYLYDSNVWSYIDNLKPSERGELEITDLNKFYMQDGHLEYTIVGGYWHDAGTSQSILHCSEWVRDNKDKFNLPNIKGV